MITPFDLTQLSCPGFTLAAGLPSGFTTDGVGCWGEPCGEPAISLHSHHVSLVQWTNPLLPVTRDLGSNPYLCDTGILLLALSRYNVAVKYYSCLDILAAAEVLNIIYARCIFISAEVSNIIYA